jgi:hypothetical protein
MRDALSTLVGAIGSRPSALDTIPALSIRRGPSARLLGPGQSTTPVCPWILGPGHPATPVRPWIQATGHPATPVRPDTAWILDSRLSPPGRLFSRRDGPGHWARCFFDQPRRSVPTRLISYQPTGGGDVQSPPDVWPTGARRPQIQYRALSIRRGPSARLLGPGQSTTPVCPDTGPWPSGHPATPSAWILGAGHGCPPLVLDPWPSNHAPTSSLMMSSEM